nr:methyl-accepting chemotaxis protein [Aquaspirillum sp.]
MAIGLQHRPLSQQLILVVSLILLLVFSILTGAVSYFGQKMAQEKAQAAMVSDAQMMRGILDAYFDNVKERGARQLQFFERWLGGTITADPNTLVKTGNKELPQIKLGDVVLNGNTDLMARFRDLTGDDTAVLQLHDGLFYRTATLLKKDGVAMNGTSLPKDDPVPTTLTQGKDYSGLVERNGKYYFSTVRALKDSQGKVFGGLSVRIALDGELAQIRQLLSSRSIGKTGYPFLMHPSSEEKGIARFVLHPRFQDKTVVEAVSDQPTQDALRKMISDKQGMIRYLLADPKSGDLLEKVVAVETSEKWNWVLAFGTWTHEFNEDTVVLRNIMMVISLCAGVLSALLILLVIRQRLKPLSEMVTAVERMGMGDLHVRVSNAEANSGNEVLRLGAALNETVNKVAGLVNQANGCAQQIASSSAQLETAAQYVLDSSSQQSSSATEIAAAIEQMSANIARVAEHASRAATLSSTARETTQEGRNVVQNTVSDMETIASDIRAS